MFSSTHSLWRHRGLHAALLGLMSLAGALACVQMLSTPAEAKAATTAATAASKPINPDDFDITTVSFGPLHVRMSAAALGKALPQCVFTKKKAELWDGDGQYHQRWLAASCGLDLDMTADHEKGPWSISMIDLKSPATLKTDRGIGIGNTQAELRAAYGAEYSPAWSGDGSSLMIGSVYGGLYFDLEKGRVTHISLGAFAE